LEWLQALSADKVINVPFLSECSNASIQDWFIAMSAFRAIDILITVLAMRTSILIVEVLRSKRSSTVSASKVFWMECLSESLNNFSENWSLASLAISSRCRIIAVDVVHLRSKILEKTI